MSGEEASASQTPDLSGKYVLERNENFDAFLAANGAGWLVRKMATSSSPYLDVTQDGNKISLRLHSRVMNRESSFTIGEEFDETQQDGAEMRVSSSWEGNKLVLKYTPKKEGTGKPQTHIRELQGDELVLTLQVDDVTAKRIFKKTA